MDVIIPPGKESGPGIQPDDTIVVTASKIFRYQLDIMRNYEQVVLSEWEAAPLHKMRVAVRRMRMAYRVLGKYISKPVISIYKKGFRKIGDSLGAVRDLDVFLLNADMYKLSLGEREQNDFMVMMTYLEKAREVHRKKLLELFGSRFYQEFINEFNQVIVNPRNLSINVVETGKSIQALSVAREIIRFRYQKLLAFDPITRDEGIERLHKIRISVKACRYSIEFFEEILGEEAKILIERLATIQDYLGEINDAAVGCVIIENFLKNDKFISQLHAGEIDEIEEYLFYLKERVKYNTANFPSIWEVIHELPFTTALEKISKFK